MKVRAVAIAALVGLAWPVVAHADLILPPEPPAKPASDPPAETADPAKPGSSSEAPPATGTDLAEPTGDAATDPTSSVQGPPKGGCASCRVGEPATDGATLPLALAMAAAALAWSRRRR